jgi:hypothetical protein
METAIMLWAFGDLATLACAAIAVYLLVQSKDIPGKAREAKRRAHNTGDIFAAVA